jgi:hypothetical protein
LFAVICIYFLQNFTIPDILAAVFAAAGVGRIKAPLIKKDQSPPYQGGLGGSKPLIKKDQSPPYQEGSKPLIKKDQSPLSRRIKAPLIKGGWGDQSPLSRRIKAPLIKGRAVSFSHQNIKSKSDHCQVK